MRICIGIPTIRADTLPVAIASVLRQSDPNWELLVVGQGTDTRMREATRAAAGGDGRVRYVHLELCGASRARNAALRLSDAEVVAFTDDDCEVREDWIARIAAAFRDPEVGAVVGSLIAPPRARKGLGVAPSLQALDHVFDPSREPRLPRGWDWVGANFALRRSTAERVGPFDECLGPGAVFPAAEDGDYRLRLESNRIKTVSSAQLVVMHTHGWRYGLRAVLAHRRAYALGYGALAAKRKLAKHDVTEMVGSATIAAVLEAARELQPERVARTALRAWYFQQAYRRCLSEFEYDAATSSLRARSAAAS
jgi:glycosyltransferase involved in cell wall biosynthesis